VNRHGFLTGLHEHYAPRTYLEIGVNDGRGLARSRTRTIGVDPAFKVVAELACDLQLVKATSDDFFARADAIGWFPEGVIDLTFIDGLHIFEFALRDFINAERLSSPASVVVFDDMLPRSVDEAARDRHTVAWTGDVYKVAQVIAQYRPDLVMVPINTQPTGLLVVVGLDPTSTVLTDHYDEILAEYVTPDPQDVPLEVMHRQAAAEPEAVLSDSAWSKLAAARTADGLPPDTLSSLRALRGTSTYVWSQPAANPLRATKPASGAASAKTSPKWTVKRIRNAIKRRL
jgi:Methyltransferase domain